MQSIPTKWRAELVLWHLTDSALPTGGFAHSAGLETFIHKGEVDSAETFAAWLDGYLVQSSFNEALAVRSAVELQNMDGEADEKLSKLRELDALLHASQTPKQVRVSMNSMGKRWARVASIVAPEDALVTAYKRGIESRDLKGNPGIAAGLVLGSLDLGVEEAVAAYLMQAATSMTQNAIRAIPLGQDAGQRVIVAAYPSILEATRLTMTRDVAEIGVAMPMLEIAQMQHESLRSRLFMS